MWILLILLLVLLLIEYIIFNRDVLSPSFVITGMFFLSTFMLTFYAERWNLIWNDKTTFVILLGIVSAVIGEIVAKKIFTMHGPVQLKFGENVIVGREIFSKNPITLNISELLLLNFICIVALIIFHRESVNLASLYTGNSDMMMMQINRLHYEGYSVSKFAQQLLIISNSIALMFIYIIMFNRKAMKHAKYRILYVTPIILYLTTATLTSSRSILFNFFIAGFIIWFLIDEREKSFIRRRNIKLFFRIVTLVVLICTVFYYVGFLTGKSLHYDTFGDNLANYFCSSIFTFNSFISNPDWFYQSNSFGIYTLSGIYSALGTLGVDIPQSIIELEYIPCGNVISNVYTPFRRYIQDFGLIGLVVIMFTISFFYSKLISLNRKKYFSGVLTIFTGMIFYPLVFMSIEDRFFMNVVRTTTIYALVYIIVLYRIFVYPQTKYNNSVKRKSEINEKSISFEKTDVKL